MGNEKVVQTHLCINIIFKSLKPFFNSMFDCLSRAAYVWVWVYGV